MDQVLAQIVENLSAQMCEEGLGTDVKEEVPGRSDDKPCSESRLDRDKRDFRTWQKIEFAKLIRERKHILFGECDGALVTAKTKEDAWRDIQSELETMGADSFKGKQWMRLRDHDWQYIRRHAMNRFENGKVSTGRLSELDQIVVEIVQGDKPINNNVAQRLYARESNDVFGAQLCSLLGVTERQSPSFVELQETPDDYAIITPPPSGGSSDNAGPALSTTGRKCNGMDNALRNALATFACAFPSPEASSPCAAPPPLSATPSRTATDPPPPKRSRPAPSQNAEELRPSLDQLQRQKLELEIEHMMNEEQRRQEQHSIQMERLNISVSILRKCLQSGTSNPDRLAALLDRLAD
ncbi:unnamed protein product, partial [Mesorhabditis spiculigera]